MANGGTDGSRLLYSSILFVFLNSFLLSILLWQSKSIGISTLIFPNGINKQIWIFFFVAQFFLIQLNQIFAAFLNSQKIFIPIFLFTLFSNVALLLFWLLVHVNVIKTNVPLFDLVWWSNTAINFGITLYSWFLIYSRTNLFKFFRIISKQDFFVLQKFAFIVYLCNTVQFLNYRMDLYFLNQFWRKADVGVYALALSVSQLIWILPNAISSIIVN